LNEPRKPVTHPFAVSGGEDTCAHRQHCDRRHKELESKSQVEHHVGHWTEKEL
jgi:hypothetical protein